MISCKVARGKSSVSHERTITMTSYSVQEVEDELSSEDAPPQKEDSFASVESSK